jgi:peroxiredoxin
MHLINLQHVFRGLSIMLSLTLTDIQAATPKPDSLAPEFTLKALNNAPVSLSGLRAKGHVMLIFWETQCVYCYAHIKDFNTLQKKYQGKLTIAGINFLGEYPEEIQEYATDNKVEYLLLADRLNNIDVAEAYQVIGSPTIVLIAPDGKILSYGYQIPDVGHWIK